jgi:hypothetical protein
MARSGKKVIAFIVEGPSDEAALGTIMKKYFSNREVQFVVVHGDITLRDYVTAENVLGKVKEQLDVLKNKYRYRNEDFLKIIHLTDTDGVFIQDELVKHAEVDAIQYYEDHIETAQPEFTIKRNHRKAEVLFKLRREGKVMDIPYKIYFNSCNLEHVLYGELKEFTNDEKQKLSDDFAEQYEDDPDGFVAFIRSDEVKTPGTYQKTWDYIEKENRSLQRYSNMHLLFE